ncbi:hypothetical protein D6777_03765 [Candidatus Woesearchaeota archaeon]|nr:MAG: hypothetical protein D6777_03765 [Candidatus Woesearchaeota archaeon]
MINFLPPLPSGLLFEIGAIIVLATFFAYFARLTKQPLIPAYVIAGVILGPIGLGIVKDIELIHSLSDIGIVFLLFIVGLEINLNKLRGVGLVSTITGIIQVGLTFLLGYLSGLLLGLNTINSVYAGLIIAFSSTLVVIKLLSDKEDLSTFHGRIMVGVLLIQDILVIIALSILSSIGSFSVTKFIFIMVGALLLFGFAWLSSKFVVHKLFKFAAKSEEFMFLLALSTCFLFVALAYMFGFSIAIGGFIAGVVLANLPYHYNIIGRILPLKDFFSTIFFVSLGMQVVISNFVSISKLLLILLGIVILIKPLIISLILAMFGYGKRISFISGLGLAQISEFSLIIIAGASSISPEIFSVTIILAVVSITLTSYIVKYEEKIYNKVNTLFNFLDRISLKHQKLSYSGNPKKTKIILIGAHRMGSIILKAFEKNKDIIKVVDTNPDIINKLIGKKVPCIYGDITNLEILKKLKFSQYNIIISTIPNEDINKRLLSYARTQNPSINIILTAQHLHEALNLYEEGADYVIVPPIMSGEKMSSMLKSIFNKKEALKKFKNLHLKHLLEMNAEL